MKKQIFIKTYTNAGVFKGVFFDFIFSSFSNSLNGGLGDLTVTVPRKWDEYNSDSAIVIGYELKIYIADEENTSGIQIYSGEIDSINASVSGGGESVTINCSGYVHQLATDLMEYAGKTIYKKYTTTEISAIIKDMLDNYQARRGDDRITYDVGATTIDSTAKSITLEVFCESPLEAIQHASIEADSDWFWRIGVDNNFYFTDIPTTPTHLFQMGKDIIEINTNRNIRDTKTSILVTNGLASGDGDVIMQRYTDSTATAEYGRRIERKRDGRYKATAGKADEFANRTLDIFKDPINVVKIRVIDSNLAGGYDIESIKPGDTCKIINITDNDALSDNMLITTITYSIDYVDLTLADTTSFVNRELLNRKNDNRIVAFTDDQPHTYTT